MIATAELSVGSFLVGFGGVLAVVALMGWGAWRLRSRLLPGWTGPPARLVEVLLVLLGLVASAEILGALDALRGAPVAATCVAVALGMALVGRSPRRDPVQLAFPVQTSALPASPRGEVAAATIGVAVVAALWVSHTAHALHRGMLHPDTLAYHGPIAARFLQSGTFGSLAGFGGEEHQFTPQNSELLHALAAVPFHRDLLSPLLNLGWAALVMLAAWCVGRRRGVGALCVLGVAAVLALPTLSGTQPGQASNDIVCAALLVTAAALLLETALTPTTAALAGAAAGLAIGTKLTLTVPVFVLTAGVIVLAVRARRRAIAVSWSSALVLAGSYWFIRDWIVAGSPAPFLNVSIGPISLRGSAPETGESAAHYFTDTSVLSKQYLPGLFHALGPGWPLLLGLGIAGAVLAAFRLGSAVERLVGLAAIIGICAYPLLPVTGAAGGSGFAADLRFLASVLLLAFILLPLWLLRAPRTWRWGACLALLGLVVLCVALRDIPADQMPTWPADGRVAGVVAALGVAIMVAVRARVSLSLRRARPAGRALAIAALCAAILTGGWLVQREYLRGRYVQTGLPGGAIFVPFRTIRDASVAVFAAGSVYPMFGLDLSNHVSRPDGPTHGTNRQLCQDWKRLLSGRYQYLVLVRTIFSSDFVPPQSWFFDPAVVNLVSAKSYSVLRLDGVLDGRLCGPRRVLRRPKPR